MFSESLYRMADYCPHLDRVLEKIGIRPRMRLLKEVGMYDVITVLYQVYERMERSEQIEEIEAFPHRPTLI